MTSRGPLATVSPLDGRYASYTEPLVEYASEGALIRARVQVEIEYLIALADCDATPFAIDDADRETLREVYESFSEVDAERVKRLETEGTDDRPATNHDVKAVEYFVRDSLPDPAIASWVHFGLTSEDVNNLARRVCWKPAVESVVLPELEAVQEKFADLATAYADTPMLARTHGQPATPTTFGKEMAVYAGRLRRSIDRVERAADGLAGKLAGASGTYAAHRAAYPEVDWRTFSAAFVGSLGLAHVEPVTQLNPGDDLARLFDALRGANRVLLDADRDAWRYVSDGYLGQDSANDETGSSTMPHKVNPIDFENSEGNLEKANSDLEFLGTYVTTSRLQRDLSDSTVKRNVGSAFAHCLIGYRKAGIGLSKVVPNERVMREDLAANPEVVGEAVQTILRREGYSDAYERVKELTRGRRTSLDDFHELFDDLDVSEATREELRALTPAGYTGLASELADSES
ncbi:adenylosuccinate lyase [Halococcus hamelinensis]|uniref:Adenylosuccinate lyase n=1 Tax=Halococcus hamelinensis 100A6 TaxID=1132509 RepID=M0LQL2_9EURY|nr:adenylosuccinate lyase [Halococcus hamelinensis]EMA35857.1 adenylosuccinate lyase [Halococcus hamelinensis 100A6]